MNLLKTKVFHAHHTYDQDSQNYIGKMVEVEILTIHFATKNMRCRYKRLGTFSGKPEVCTFEADATDVIDRIILKEQDQ